MTLKRGMEHCVCKYYQDFSNKLSPWVDLDQFNAKVKFGDIGFCVGKSEKYLFFRNYCSLWSQICLKLSAK